LVYLYSANEINLILKKRENFLLRLSEHSRIWITNFRTSNLYLPIATGRWYNIPREERICHLCKETIHFWANLRYCIYFLKSGAQVTLKRSFQISWIASRATPVTCNLTNQIQLTLFTKLSLYCYNVDIVASSKRVFGYCSLLNLFTSGLKIKE
jgi:hypothetical protein